ncbi:hypothetical protein Tco_0874730 [Tanacetum coccineum]|uniref:Uncharacterized protein n=1 Tax=Tanacetum coccineum TaxID=301880 RepID=A0ABQ5BP58_9ASTR
MIVAYSFQAQPQPVPQLEMRIFRRWMEITLKDWQSSMAGGFVDCQSKEVHLEDRKELGLQRKIRIVSLDKTKQYALMAISLLKLIKFPSDSEGTKMLSNNFEVEPVNYALMAISSSSSSSSFDNEVQKCSKQCLESFKTLQNNYDSEREKHSRARLEIQGYKLALESLESRILVHEKNELAWGEKYEFQNYEIKCREIKINNLNLELEKVVKERDELKLMIEKWEESFKILDELLNRQMSARDKTSLRYSTQLNEMSNNSKTDSEISLSVFYVRSSDEENAPANNRFSKAYGFHVVPSPITGNFLTPRSDISFAGLDEYAIRKKIIEDKFIIEDWNSDDEDNVSEVKIVSPVKTNETQIVKTRVDKIGQTSQKQGIGFKKIKACFVCKSTDHLIKDYNFHDKQSQEPKLKTIVNTGPRVVLIKKGHIRDIVHRIIAVRDELKFNLFSVSQMCDKKNSVLFTETECLILSPSFKLLDESQVVLRAPRKDDVYSFLWRLQELASPKQTVLSKANDIGKDFPNPFMAGSLPKTIKQSNDPPLSRGYTLRSGEDSLELMELMANCIQIVYFVRKKNREIWIDGLEKDLQQTKKIYSTALTKLVLRVKKLEYKLKSGKARRKEKIEEEVHEKPSDETKVIVQKETPTEIIEEPGSSEKGEIEISTASRLKVTKVSIAAAHVYTRRKAKDKGKAIMEELATPKKVKKRTQVQLSMDEELARKMEEEERVKFNAEQEARALQEEDEERLNLEATWVWDHVNTFIPIGSEVEKGKPAPVMIEKKAVGTRRKTLARRRVSDKQVEDSSKR